LASFAVTTIVVVVLLFATTVVAPLTTTVDWAAVVVPAVPVALKVTGLPVRPLTVAVTVFVPAVCPSVHDVSVAMPALFVVNTAGLTGPIALPEPLGVVSVNVTLTPATGLDY
jgi:hypothetical protein